MDLREKCSAHCCNGNGLSDIDFDGLCTLIWAHHFHHRSPAGHRISMPVLKCRLISINNCSCEFCVRYAYAGGQATKLIAWAGPFIGTKALLVRSIFAIILAITNHSINQDKLWFDCPRFIKLYKLLGNETNSTSQIKADYIILQLLPIYN